MAEKETFGSRILLRPLPLRLRDYQQDMLRRIRRSWEHGRRSVLCQMPTGTGKTMVAVAVIAEFLDAEATQPIQDSEANHPIPDVKENQPIPDVVADIPTDGEADHPKGTGTAKGMGDVLVVAHRRELIAQIRRTVRRFGLPEGRVVVQTVQGLAARRRRETDVGQERRDGRMRQEERHEGERLHPCGWEDGVTSAPEQRYGLVIVDEAHHAVAETYAALWRRWPEARFLGLTATPCRLSGEGFAGLFDALLTSWPVRKFIAEGWLAPYDYVSVRATHGMQRRVASLRRRGADGDYQVREMATVLDTEESVSQLYEAYRTFAHGKKGIIYAINRAHARRICNYYAARGVRIAAIDSRTPAARRQELVARYEGAIDSRVAQYEVATDNLVAQYEGAIYNKESRVGAGVPRGGHENPAEAAVRPGRAHTGANRPAGCGHDEARRGAEALDVLVNVDIFSEGYDCPSVEFVQLARPTLSLSKYLQQVGRGLRIGSGKRYVTVIDNVGLYRLFGLPSADREWMAYYLGERRGMGDPEKAATGGPAVAAERMTSTEAWTRMLAAQELEIIVRSSAFGSYAGEREAAGIGEETPLTDRGATAADRSEAKWNEGLPQQSIVLSPRRVLPDGRLLAGEERPELVEVVQRVGRYAVVRWRLGGTAAYAVVEQEGGDGCREAEGGEPSSSVWTDLYPRLGRDFPLRPALEGDELLRVCYTAEAPKDGECRGEAAQDEAMGEQPTASSTTPFMASPLLEALTWYMDLRSGEEYAFRPRPIRWDFVEALEDGVGDCRLRVPEAKGRAECAFRREDVRLNGDVWVAGRLLVHRSMPQRVFRLLGYDAAGHKRLETLTGERYVMRPGFAPQAMAHGGAERTKGKPKNRGGDGICHLRR